jgi:hypothetical protein
MFLYHRNTTFKKVFVLAVLTFASITLHSVSASADRDGANRDDDRDQVILSFSTVGDSRQDPVNPDLTTLPLSGQDALWLQNTRAWSRIIRSIESQKSNLLFFNGDMIMGYGNATVPVDNSTVAGIVGSDLMKFYQQYAFWRGMVAELMETGTYVVPVPGNHETQCKACGKKALEVNENAWRANMGDLILDDARLQNILGEQPSYENLGNNGGADDLSTDQSKLSYSFDFRGSHFVVINTDPVGNDAHAPVRWLANDLADARARGAQHFFVFGHKPAYTYYYGAAAALPSKPSGLDIDPASRDAFWDVIEQYGAIYFCGHEHIFNMLQPRASLGGKAWQVLVGSGGSPFEAGPTDVTVAPRTDRDYAWATVKIYQSGKVKIAAYGFDDQYGPTHVIESTTLR